MPEYILSEVLKCGFATPTPIQSQGWPMALKGRNMVRNEILIISFFTFRSIRSPYLSGWSQCYWFGKDLGLSSSCNDSHQCSGTIAWLQDCCDEKVKRFRNEDFQDRMRLVDLTPLALFVFAALLSCEH